MNTSALEHKNEMVVFSKEKLLQKAKDRLTTKPYHVDGIAMYGIDIQGKFFDKLFKAKHVGKELSSEYENWLTELAENSKFLTSEGVFELRDLDCLQINSQSKEVYIVLAENKKNLPLCCSNAPAKRVIASDINRVEMQIAEKVKSSINKNIANFKALPELPIVFKHILPDLDMNTSYAQYEKLDKALKELSADDEDQILIKQMAADLLFDLQTIFSDVEIYWG